jgi:SHS2 domain-containing protein
MRVGVRRGQSGFEEVEHTGDRALYVWALTWDEFLRRSAEGLYEVLGIDLAPRPRVRRELTLEAEDVEALLIVFLNELIFLADYEGLGFDVIEIEASEAQIKARMEGAAIQARRHDVKAATFGNLAVVRNELGFLEATILFDV